MRCYSILTAVQRPAQTVVEMSGPRPFPGTPRSIANPCGPSWFIQSGTVFVYLMIQQMIHYGKFNLHKITVKTSLQYYKTISLVHSLVKLWNLF